MNKEKILFLVTILLSLPLFSYYFQKAFVRIPSLSQIEDRKGSGDFVETPRMLSDRAYIPWRDCSREMFQKISEKRQLRPIDLALPPMTLSYKPILPPIPAPLPKYWTRFSSAVFIPLAQDSIVEIDKEILEASLKHEMTISSGELARQIQSQVRACDTIVLDNNRKWNGTILKESDVEIIIHVPQPYNRTYTWPRNIVKELERTITLEQVCQRHFRQLPSKDFVGLIQLAQACGELGLEELAVKYFNHLLEAAPELPTAHLAYADYHIKRLQYEEAYRIYLRALQKIDAQEIRCNMAKMEAQLGFHRRALNTLHSCQSIPSLFMTLDSACILKQWDTCQQILERLSQAISSDTEYWNQFCYWKAKLALHHGEIEQCLEWCRKSKSPTMAAIENLEGVALYLQGKLPESMKLLQHAAQNRVVSAWHNLALVYFAGNAPTQAMEILKSLYNRGVLDDPSLLLCCLAYITHAANPNDAGEPFRLIQLAERSNPGNFWIYYLAGEIHSGDRSHKYYQKAFNLEFTMDDCLLKSAILLLRENKLTEASHCLEELETRNSIANSAYLCDVYITLAQICGIRNDMNRARSYLQKILQIDQANQSALDTMAWVDYESGNIENAISGLQKVLAKDAQHKYASEALQQIMRNKNRRLWEDMFNRADGDFIRQSWIELEPQGTDIRLRQKEVVFSGRTATQNQLFALIRRVDFKKFVGVSFKVNYNPSSKCAGIFIAGYPDGPALYFGKDRDNQLKYPAQIPMFKMGPQYALEIKRWQSILQNGQPIIIQGSHVLGISKETKDTYRILLDGKELPPQIPLNLEVYLQIQIGFFGFADQDGDWSFSIDDAQIIENKS